DVGAEHTPMHPATLRRDVAEGTIEHATTADAISAHRHLSRRVAPILFPGDQANILQRHIEYMAQNIEPAPGHHRDVGFAFFQPDPLIANNGAAALDDKAIVMIGGGLSIRIVTGHIKTTALDDEISIATRYGVQLSIVAELPGDIAKNAAVL